MNDRALDPLSGPFVSERFFRAFPEAAAFVFGPAAFSALVETLPPSVVAALTPAAAVGTTDRAPISLASVQRLWWAVFDGPAGGDIERYVTFARRALVEGFSVTGELRLSALSKEQVAHWAAELWREDHGCGALTAHVEDGAWVLRLQSHPFAADPLAAMTLGAFYQQALGAAQGDEAVTLEVTALDDESVEFRYR